MRRPVVERRDRNQRPDSFTFLEIIMFCNRAIKYDYTKESKGPGFDTRAGHVRDVIEHGTYLKYSQVEKESKPFWGLGEL